MMEKNKSLHPTIISVLGYSHPYELDSTTPERRRKAAVYTGSKCFFKPETPEVTPASSATAAYFLHNTTHIWVFLSGGNHIARFPLQADLSAAV